MTDLTAEPDLTAADRLAAAQRQFHPEVTYLNTPTAGLPPDDALAALGVALAHWRAGTMDPVSYDQDVARSRAAYARLVDVPLSWVAVGSQVSVLAGLIAASLPEGSVVLTAEGDFTSILFPFLAQAGRGIAVQEVPLADLADAVTPSTSLVSVSAVQSADGRVAALDDLVAACELTGTHTLLDTSQAAGWLPIGASRFSYTVCGAYKWLLSPRGTAFLTVRPDLMDAIIPHAAGWYAAPDPWAGIYGSPLRLAADARRFDVSPAWHLWVGAAPALELLAEIGVPALHEHSVGLANRFRAQIGMPAGDSAIVSLQAAGGERVAAALREHQVAASVRAGRVRLGFHLANTPDDASRVARVLAAIAGLA
jgi:selenocysteine lyase/cysteine desulfurase